MSTDLPSRTAGAALASLRRYLRPRAAGGTRCDLGSAALADDHLHLVELPSRRLCCACEPCAILFSSPAAAKYRRVPRRVEHLAGFRLTDVQWQGLQLPIELAFFLHSTPAGRVVAFYPSPSGATEALPPEDAWQTLADDNPCLRDLEPDVEALLVNRLGTDRQHYRAGVDVCFELVGLVRSHWRGLSGGTAVWAEIGRFFARLRERSSPPRASHA
jgi:hypothetical protein